MSLQDEDSDDASFASADEASFASTVAGDTAGFGSAGYFSATGSRCSSLVSHSVSNSSLTSFFDADDADELLEGHANVERAHLMYEYNSAPPAPLEQWGISEMRRELAAELTTIPQHPELVGDWKLLRFLRGHGVVPISEPDTCAV